jgi:two-component system response regulator (stage 0 sporulation protein A)
MLSIRIGIADDNADFCRVLEEFLSAQPGLKVTRVFHNGLEVIQTISGQEFDVLLLDLVMPHLDGLGVLHWLKEHPETPRPKVIIFSAMGQEEITRKAITYGANYYILKPFDLSALVQRIKEVAGVFPGTITTASDESGDLEQEVTAIIQRMKVPVHFKGYTYLRDAIMMAVADPSLINEITKRLYPMIAERHDTNNFRVERALRFAIETAWKKGDLRNFPEFLQTGATGQAERPTNAALIAKISDNLRLQRKSRGF